MIKQLNFKIMIPKGLLNSGVIILFLFSFGSIISQEIIITKTSIESPTICNQFDISLEIIGDPPPRPQEVILIIDRSGSMDDGVYPEPIDYAKDAAINFVNELFLDENNPTGLNKVSIVSYSTLATLDIGLTDSSGKQNILDTINTIVTGGWTNIEDGLVKADDELINNGTFDCATSRSIILLTDGVATFRNGSSTSCDSTTEDTECQLAAIEAGINAQTTIVDGEEYAQSIFTIGLVGALWGIEQEIALNTLDQIQNKGAFWTEDNADLSGIYSQILGQLVSAAQQLPGEALVSDTITDGFELVTGSVIASKGTTTVSGQVISWFVSDVSDETITLNYSILATSTDVCGDQEAGTTIMNYEDSNCNEQILIFENPGFCVPCSEITAEIEYNNCDSIIDYSGELFQGNCSPITGDFSWEFYLNNILAGTSNTQSGSFEYTDGDPFIGEFRAELTFTGTYGNGCVLPDVITDTTIFITGFPELSINVDPHVLCFGGSSATIDLTVSSGTPPYTYLWNTGDTTEDLVNVPAGIYSVVVTDDFGCSTVTSEDIIVTEPEEITSIIVSQTAIECTGFGSVTIEADGGTPPYTFSADSGFYQDTGVFNNLTEGNHIITIKDANDCTETIDVFIVNNCLALIKEGFFNDENQDGCANDDETISYVFTVINTGNVILTEITVYDPLVTVLGNTIPTLNPGESNQTNFTADYTINQNDIENGEVINQATAEAITQDNSIIIDLSDDNSELENDPTITNLCQDPSIALIKIGTFNDENMDGCTNIGETISYEFTVINTGNVTLTNVIILDPLVTVIGGPISSLEIGISDATTFTASYSITQLDIENGEVINQATAEATAPDQTTIIDLSDDNSELQNDPTITELCQPTSIALIKVGTFNDEDQDGCTDVGETISYLFTVVNTGYATLTNINVTDPLVLVLGGSISSLAPGTSDATTFTASYSVTQEDINAGFFENQALVEATTPDQTTISDLSDNENELEDNPTITNLCQNSNIAVIKEVQLIDDNGNGCADEGEALQYTFLIKNLGNRELINISIIDPLVDVIGDPITLQPLEEDTTTFTATYIITEEDVINSGEVINQATVEAITPEGDIVSDLSDKESYFEDNPTVFNNFCVVIISIDIASISVEKIGEWNDENGNLISEVGETISYVFSVINTGEVDLFNITIDDPLPGIVLEGGSISSLLVGETDNTTFTATYIITETDIENGEVINQAIVTGTDENGEIVKDDSDDPNNPTNIDTNLDGEPDDPTMVILPLVAGVTFEIFNGITPNGDGFNDFFEIRGIDQYPNNNVKIFNRWGILIWETNGYDESLNVYKGEADTRMMVGSNNDTPSGIYFYLLTFSGENPGKDSYSGYLYINR